MLPEIEAIKQEESTAVKLEGPDGQGALMLKEEDIKDPNLTSIKTEDDRLDW